MRENKLLFVVTCNLQVDFVSAQDFPSGSVIKNLPPNAGDQETQVGSLGWEDHMEKEMATHSSILAWKIVRT